MPDKRIPELNPVPLVDGTLLTAVYDQYTDTTYRMPLSSIGVSVNTDAFWEPDTDYPALTVVIADDRYWKSLVSPNINNYPIEGANWTEVSKAGSSNPLEQKTINTAGAILDLDFEGTKQRMFLGSNPIAVDKTIELNNTSNALICQAFHFNLAAAPVVLQLPANVKSNYGGWNNGTKELSIYEVGDYKMELTHDLTNDEWLLELAGPF